jgi:carbon-monoxide dehydrogenase large subunit
VRFHSRSTILGGSAVFEGARALLDKIRVAAAARLGGSANEIELVDGRARISGGRSVSFAELAADGLRVDAAFANNNKLTYAYGSAAAHVAIDPGTGRVELLDYLVVEDVGRISGDLCSILLAASPPRCCRRLRRNRSVTPPRDMVVAACHRAGCR